MPSWGLAIALVHLRKTAAELDKSIFHTFTEVDAKVVTSSKPMCYLQSKQMILFEYNYNIWIL